LKISALAVAVVDAADGILKSLLDVETAQRGFTISGDEVFLGPFAKAEAALPGQFDHFADLAGNNPTDLRQMTDLRAQAEVALAYSRRVVTTRRERGFEAAADIVKTGEGRLVMDKVRAKVEEIKSSHDLLTSTEGRSSQGQLLRASLTSLIAGAIGIGAGLFAMYLAGIALKQQQRERALLEDKLRAERENREKSTFLANLSHEIRTPMNAILGFSELLSAELRDPKHRQYLQSIRTSAGSLLQLINDILDMSKVEAGVLELHPDPTDPREICDFVTTVFSETAHKKGVKLVCNTAGDLPRALLLDRVRLRQILVNLVGNAVKFTDEGHIYLTVAWEKHEVSSSHITLIIEVRDTGVGIPQDRLDAIFKPFVQAGRNLDKEKMGTGLGLAIVHRLVEAMGGTVTVASVVGQGSAFHLRFPSVPISARLPAPDDDNAEARTDFNLLRAAKILVVDDNQQNCDLIAGMFSHSHHQLEFGVNGQEAVDKASRFHPDVLLLDIRMPRMDGRAALAEIRKTSGLELLPIIAISASNMTTDEQNVRESFSGYLRKPFTQRELFSELAQFLPQTKQERTPEPPPPSSAINPVPVAGAWQGLSNQLRGLEIHEWPGLRDSLAVNETREFALKLGALARETNCDPLLAYATALGHYADTYAVDEMEKHLQQFPALIARVELPGL
jgi:signal transduction histidine kinase/CheY-like chemotaxis protein